MIFYFSQGPDMKKIICTAFLFIFTSLSFLSAQNSSRIVIDSGHSSAVGSIAYHERSGRLITCDDTGVVKIWDLQNDKLEYRLDTGLRGSIEVKVHPEKYELALLVTRPGYSGLSVWDWRTGRNKFTKTLTGRPIQFEYSGKGRFLFTTRVDNPSIVIYNSQTGREHSYLKRLQALFSYAYIGDKEATVMTYSNSGYLRFYDIRTASLKNESSTKADLSELSVMQTEGKRYILGRKDNSLFLIDRLNGEVSDAMSAEGMLDFSLDQSNGIITILSSTGSGRLKISHTSTAGAHFTPVSTPAYLAGRASTADTDDSGWFRVNEGSRALISAKNRVYLSDGTGVLWTLNSSSGRPELFKKNEIVPIQDLSFEDNKLYMLTDDRLMTLSSRFFGSTGVHDLKRLGDLSIRTIDSPLKGDTFLESYDGSKLLIWSAGDGSRDYVLYDPENDKVLGDNNSFPSTLKELHVRDDRILALESSGEASLSNIYTGIREFSFSALGMVSLNFIDENRLLAGKSLMKTGKNPLFTVQTDTGEILPVTDDRFLIQNIINPETGNKIYSTGLRLLGDGSMETQIRSHSKTNPSSSSLLYSKDGEWMQSILTVDSNSYTPTLYGSISGREILRIRGSQKKSWNYDKNIRSLFFHKSVLYILNTDGSLTLFDPQRGLSIVNYFLMKDGSWIAIPSGSGEKPYVNKGSAAGWINSYSSSTGRSNPVRYRVVNVAKDD